MSRVLKATIKYSVKTLSDRSKVTLGRSHSIAKTLFELKVKLNANILPLAVSLAVWLTGVGYYFLFEPVSAYPEFAESQKHVSLYTACVIAVGIRSPELNSDVSAMYQLCWPIFLEVVVFGLLTTALLGNFNPKLLAKLYANHRRNHVVVIGYSHLGHRVVEFLIEKRIPYVLIDQDEHNVKDFISVTEPVVVGDIKELSTVKDAQVQYCKEVFILCDEFQSSVIACFHIRALNPTCPIYVQTFEEGDFAQYFAEELNVKPFSIWQWAKDSVKEWTEKDQVEMREVVIFGARKLSQKIAEYVAGDRGNKVHVICDSMLDRYLPNFSNVEFHQISTPWHCFHEVEKAVDFRKVTHIFVTWKERDEVIRIAIFLKKQFPQIQLFIRVFDEVIGDVVRGLGAHDFSTSSFAFSMLRREVFPSSTIYLPPRPIDNLESSKSLLRSRKDNIGTQVGRRHSHDFGADSKVSSSRPHRLASLFHQSAEGEAPSLVKSSTMSTTPPQISKKNQ